MTDLAALQSELRRSLLRDSLLDFSVWAWPLMTGRPLVLNHASHALIATLQAIGDGRLTRTLIALPPGVGKTTQLAIYAVWRLARDPAWRSIHASHSYALAAVESRRVRRLVESAEFLALFPGVRLRDDEATIDAWATTRDGRYYAVGTDTGLTGKRAHEAVLDDPLNATDRYSNASREGLWAWFQEALSTRLDGDHAPITIVQQRLDPDDLIGRCLAQGGWTIVELPAEYDSTRRCVLEGVWADPRTEDGELLAPEVLPREKLETLKVQIGALNYLAQFQQRPAPAGGAIVKLEQLRFHRAPGMPDATATRPRGAWTGPSVETPSAFDVVVLAGDLGMGRKTRAGDFNVLGAIGRKGSSFFVCDVWRERADFPEVQSRFKALAAKYPTALKVIERAAAGGSLETSLRAEIPGLISLPPTGTKLMRLHAVLAFFAAGNVHLDEHWPGLHDAIAELVAFNGSGAGHDDFVDFLSLGLSQCAAFAEPIIVDGGYSDGDWC